MMPPEGRGFESLRLRQREVLTIKLVLLLFFIFNYKGFEQGVKNNSPVDCCLAAATSASEAIGTGVTRKDPSVCARYTKQQVLMPAAFLLSSHLFVRFVFLLFTNGVRSFFNLQGKNLT